MNTLRLLARFAGIGFTVMTISPSFASTTFEDVPQNAWFAQYVQQALDAGIASGYKNANGVPTGSFGPADPVTGAEALKMVLQAAGYSTDEFPLEEWWGKDDCIHWICPYLPLAAEENIGGFFGIFGLGDLHRFDKPITRAHLAGMIGQAFTFDIINTIDQRYFPPNPYSDIANVKPGFNIDEYDYAILKLTQDHVVSGDTDAQGNILGTFRPDDYLNRAEALKMILGAMKTYGKHKDVRNIISCLTEGVGTYVESESSNPCCEGLNFVPEGNNGHGVCERASE